jgi:hypothetical protein
VRDLGYFEGNNIVFEYRFAEDKYNTADLCEAKAMLEELS